MVSMSEENRVTERFYFDLTDGYTAWNDGEGIEAPSLDHALAQALVALKEMRQNGEVDQLGEGWQMIVRDDAGVVRQTFVIHVRQTFLIH
jgi:hypothetical protein